MLDSEDAARVIGAVVRGADAELEALEYEERGLELTPAARHAVAIRIANRVREILEAPAD